MPSHYLWDQMNALTAPLMPVLPAVISLALSRLVAWATLRFSRPAKLE